MPPSYRLYDIGIQIMAIKFSTGQVLIHRLHVSHKQGARTVPDNIDEDNDKNQMLIQWLSNKETSSILFVSFHNKYLSRP